MHGRIECDAGCTIQPAAVFDRCARLLPGPPPSAPHLLRFLIYLVQALKLTGHT